MASTARQRRGLAGVSKLRRKLRRMPEAVQAPVKRAIAAAAEELRFEMLKRVPVRYGDLAGGIEVKLSRDKLAATVGVGAKTTRARREVGWRAKFEEFGTIHTPAHPFVFPALKAMAPSIRKDIDKAVIRGLDTLVLKT